MLHRSEAGQGRVVEVPGGVVAAPGGGGGQLGVPQRPGHSRSGDARLDQCREGGLPVLALIGHDAGVQLGQHRAQPAPGERVTGLIGVPVRLGG